MAEASDLAYWVLLHAVPEMGPVTFRRVVDRFGTPRAAVEEGTRETLAEVRGMTRDLAERVIAARTRLDWAERTTDTCLRRGMRILRLSDPAYPAPLHDLISPPPLVYLIGDIGAKDARAVSMVGTTKPSDKGRSIADEFAARLSAAGVTVVSGYAHGIDAASHRGAFRGGGRSILCIPYGIGRYKSRPDFPPLAELSERGGVLSECPPEMEWNSAAAVARDRIIAALGRATFVIETRPRGGTMHTVEAAESLGRPVFALQYRKPPESARGNSLLIARGATGIGTFADIGRILEAVDRVEGSGGGVQGSGTNGNG